MGEAAVLDILRQALGSLLWMDADLQPPIAPAAWRLWTCPFTPEPGRLRLSVRATDGTGALQTSEVADPAPNGASGLHSIQIAVA